MFNQKLTDRIIALETRTTTLENQVLALKKMNLASIDDNPPTVEGAFAIKEIIKASKLLANAQLKKDAFGTPLHQAAAELLSWIESIEK